MMSAPQPYPTVGINAPAPDDAQIEKKMPSICVDYLSHNWTQEDVWQSWKAMTKRKNEVSVALLLVAVCEAGETASLCLRRIIATALGWKASPFDTPRREWCQPFRKKIASVSCVFVLGATEKYLAAVV